MTFSHLTPSRSRASRSLSVLVATLVVFGLTACQAQAPAETEPAAPEPVAEAVTPERIAALGYEATELLATLGLEDHIAIMPEAVMNEALGSHQDVLGGVETTYAVEKELTAEAVIDARPDLVVMSPRHGADDTIGQVLMGAGIETLVTPNHWSTPAELIENVRLIGEAVGASAEAEALAATLEAGLAPRAGADTGASADAGADAPSILILSNQAGRPFITAGTAFPVELVKLAGAVPASEALGITVTGPIQIEQVLAADPDGILLIDMNGSGDRLFSDVMSNEAVMGLDAVAEGRVLRVQGKEVQALGLTHTIGGLDRIAEWVSELNAW